MIRRNLSERTKGALGIVVRLGGKQSETVLNYVEYCAHQVRDLWLDEGLPPVDRNTVIVLGNEVLIAVCLASPSVLIGAAMRRLLAQPNGTSSPSIGMPAFRVAPARAYPMVIVSVQAGGRRVLAKVKNMDQVCAFTRRPDDNYRLEGTSDHRGDRLIIGASL